jgi:hypothetical protein
MKHYLGLCLVLVTLAAVAMTLLKRCENTAARSVSAITRTFQSVLQVQPEIRINQTVITTQTAPIAELAIVSKDQLVHYSLSEQLQLWHHNIPLTTKSISVQAVYRIKAGYNLQEPFRVSIDSRTGKISAQLPPAHILSIERIGELSLSDHDELLNRISTDERAQVLNELDRVARTSAEQSGIVQDAEKQSVVRLQELAAKNGQTFFFIDPTYPRHE